MTVRSICLSKLSEPPVIIESSLKALKPDQVRLKMLFSPINPADLNMMDGHYVIQPDCPFTLGNEGVGVIVERGADVDQELVGKRVFFPFQTRNQWFGFWSNYVTVTAKGCILVPDFIDDQQAAMLGINPLTALVMLTQYGALTKDDWIVQNAANSALGRWVIYIANQLGFQTINIIRDEAMINPLLELGAQSVLVFEKNFSRNISQKGSIKLALNGVGGDSAKELAKCLGSQGTLVTYGAMSKEPVSIGNVALIYKCILATGFNRSVWAESMSVEDITNLYNRLFTMLKRNPFTIPVNDVFDFCDVKPALNRAFQSGLNGKVLLRFS
tara:strand:+ start:7294 stop:8277 length:984 start_codon:yes stop_codon:yes gene_type:complete